MNMNMMSIVRNRLISKLWWMSLLFVVLAGCWQRLGGPSFVFVDALISIIDNNNLIQNPSQIHNSIHNLSPIDGPIDNPIHDGHVSSHIEGHINEYKYEDNKVPSSFQNHQEHQQNQQSHRQYRRRLGTPSLASVQTPQKPVLMRSLEEEEGFVAPTVPDFPEDTSDPTAMPSLSPKGNTLPLNPGTGSGIGSGIETKPQIPIPGSGLDVVQQVDTSGVTTSGAPEESISAISSVVYIVFPILLSFVGILAMQLYRRFYRPENTV